MCNSVICMAVDLTFGEETDEENGKFRNSREFRGFEFRTCINWLKWVVRYVGMPSFVIKLESQLFYVSATM